MSSYDRNQGSKPDETNVEDPPLSPTGTMVVLVAVLLVLVGVAGFVVL